MQTQATPQKPTAGWGARQKPTARQRSGPWTGSRSTPERRAPQAPPGWPWAVLQGLPAAALAAPQRCRRWAHLAHRHRARCQARRRRVRVPGANAVPVPAPRQALAAARPTALAAPVPAARWAALPGSESALEQQAWHAGTWPGGGAVAESRTSAGVQRRRALFNHARLQARTSASRRRPDRSTASPDRPQVTLLGHATLPGGTASRLCGRTHCNDARQLRTCRTPENMSETPRRSSS